MSFTRPKLPPLLATATLVELYHTDVPPEEWPNTTVDDDILTGKVNTDGRIRLCVTIGVDAKKHMAVPVAPAAAAAYLLLEAGADIEEVRRFLAPGISEFSSKEEIDPEEPRAVLSRTMKIFAAGSDAHEEYEVLGLLLTAWNLWVTGEEVRYIQWRKREEMPRIKMWLSDSPLSTVGASTEEAPSDVQPPTHFG